VSASRAREPSPSAYASATMRPNPVTRESSVPAVMPMVARDRRAVSSVGGSATTSVTRGSLGDQATGPPSAPEVATPPDDEEQSRARREHDADAGRGGRTHGEERVGYLQGAVGRHDHDVEAGVARGARLDGEARRRVEPRQVEGSDAVTGAEDELLALYAHLDVDGVAGLVAEADRDLSLACGQRDRAAGGQLDPSHLVLDRRVDGVEVGGPP